MKKRFYNPHALHAKRGIFHFMLWQLGYYDDCEPLPPIPKHFTFPNRLDCSDPSRPLVTWINHSTFWVRHKGIGILTDPIWNQRCSPSPFIGPKRHIEPLPPINQLKPVDFVIISHDHYDHLDQKTVLDLQSLFPSLIWIVPIGVKKWFKRWNFSSFLDQVIELNWWQQIEIKGVSFTAVPAQHFSGRGLFDRNRSLWMGCICQLDLEKRFYFAGDTGYNSEDFKEIGKKWGSMDLSLIPIGVYAPRKFMKPIHVHPAESVLIHQEVGSKLSLGGHWGTFRLSEEEMDRPPFDLYLALEQARLSHEHFRVLHPGQTINW